MANLAKTTVFTSNTPPKETLLDKTTRIVRRITEDEAEIRHQKTVRLRNARIESEADTPDASPTS
ncbi:hypothetical protein [Pseudophaeobacter flagellatus]|uniref:hypothetical protein n=1 Tax=Pseudophaeobacter flagellatus TaxID=2899119 RepID=UPI001E4F57DB|nr:hypothetical protein [Pseudophaeobacter flagellatus]MCD9147357.1 hypothetical protein [Pseudophaeobacter flagellatus]